MNVDDHTLRTMIRDLDQAVDEGTMPPLALDDLRAARARVASALDRIEGRKVQKPTKEQIEAALRRTQRVPDMRVVEVASHFTVYSNFDESPSTLNERLHDAEKLLVAAGFDAYRVGARVEVRA